MLPILKIYVPKMKELDTSMVEENFRAMVGTREQLIG